MDPSSGPKGKIYIKVCSIPGQAALHLMTKGWIWDNLHKGSTFSHVSQRPARSRMPVTWMLLWPSNKKMLIIPSTHMQYSWRSNAVLRVRAPIILSVWRASPPPRHVCDLAFGSIQYQIWDPHCLVQSEEGIVWRIVTWGTMGLLYNFTAVLCRLRSSSWLGHSWIGIFWRYFQFIVTAIVLGGQACLP